MSSGHAIRLIAGRELLSRLQHRVYVIGTLLVAALAAAGVVVLGLSGDEATELGVVETAVPVEALAAAIEADDADVELVELADRPAAEAAVADGDVTAALVDPSTLVVGEGPPGAAQSTLHRLASTAMQQATFRSALRDRGLGPTEVAGVLSAPEPVATVQPGGEDAGPPVGLLLAYATTGLLLGAIMLNASLLLTGANQEKSSRVVEVLLGKIRPWQLMAGKLLAVAPLALAQLALVVGAALAANAAVGAFELPAAAPAAVVTSLLMVVAGFTLFGALFIAGGSLAVSVENAQSATLPIQLVVMGTFFLVMFRVLPSPDGTLAQVLSYLPPTAPLVVPARVALEGMPGWQVALSVAITVAGVVALVRLAGRLYSAALLAGDKLTWRDALRAEPIR